MFVTLNMFIDISFFDLKKHVYKLKYSRNKKQVPTLSILTLLRNCLLYLPATKALLLFWSNYTLEI